MSRGALFRLSLSLLLGFGLAACGAEDDTADDAAGGDAPRPSTDGDGDGVGEPAEPGGPGDAPAPAADTYHAGAEAVLRANCVSCHHDGGAAPFPLDSYEMAAQFAGASLAAMEAGRMPPWQPSRDCHDLVGERGVTPEELATFRDWVANGAPEGETPADYVPYAAPSDEGQPGMVVGKSPEAYVPDDSRPDDYRCFILDADFPEDTFVHKTWVVPDQRALVHHVLVFVIDEATMPSIEAQDAADEGPGYTCFGGAGGGNVGPLAGWVPGQIPQVWPEGVSGYIPAGGKLVMQVHYNAIAATPVPDQTEFHLDVSSEPTPMESQSRPLAIPTLRIPAGEVESVHEQDFTNRSDTAWVVDGFTPHMHLLGTEIRLDKVRADGSTECLVHIPDWDFNWQQGYDVPEPLTVEPGESLRVKCVYDNSMENQPVVNGEQIAPRDVTWGEGTFDEMCLVYLRVRTELAPEAEDEGPCGGYGACAESCADPDSLDCRLNCGTTSIACAQCSLFPTLGAAGCLSSCAAAFAPAEACLTRCATEALTTGQGMVAECMKDSCPEIYEDVAACADPLIQSGACDETAAACGI